MIYYKTTNTGTGTIHYKGKIIKPGETKYLKFFINDGSLKIEKVNRQKNIKEVKENGISTVMDTESISNGD